MPLIARRWLRTGVLRALGGWIAAHASRAQAAFLVARGLTVTMRGLD